MAFTLAAPEPYAAFQALSGNQYSADKNGIISGIAANDVDNLLDAGCRVPGFLARILGFDMNATTDQPFTLLSKLPFRITKITVTNATISLDSAVGGVYPALAKGGTPIVAAAQAYAALTAANIPLDLTIASDLVLPGGSLVVPSLTTPEGEAGTADWYLYADLL